MIMHDGVWSEAFLWLGGRQQLLEIICSQGYAQDKFAVKQEEESQFL